MMKVDMHVHSLEGSGCSSLPVMDTVKRLKQRGINGMLMTDHESIEGFNSVNKEELGDFKVFCGFEYQCIEGDFIVILPDEGFISYKQGTKAIELAKHVHSLGGIIGVAHMFRDEYSLGNIVKPFDRIVKILTFMDFIEVENGKASDDANFTALWWAVENCKAQTKGSDSHHEFEVGKAYTSFTVDIDNNKELILAIKNRDMVLDKLASS